MLRSFTTALIAVAVAAAIGFAWAPEGSVSSALAAPQGAAGYTAAPGGAFTLVDQRGRTVTDQDFRGKYLLVFFGYTFCPDVCPTTLNEIANAMDLLGARSDLVQPIFITIDPARDTPEVIAEYVNAFDPRIVGLTGTPEQIKQVAGAYRAFYKKRFEGDPHASPAARPAHDANVAHKDGEESEESDFYFMDHSAFTYLMAPDGAYLTIFGYGTSPEDMVAVVDRQMDERNQLGDKR